MSATPDPNEIVLRFSRLDGRPVVIRPIATDAVTAGGPEVAGGIRVEPQPNIAGPGHATVRWNGVEYTLTAKQRRVVAILWQAREEGTPFVPAELLLEEADSVGGRLADLFKRSPAWGKLVCRGIDHGGRVGTFCLPPAN